MSTNEEFCREMRELLSDYHEFKNEPADIWSTISSAKLCEFIADHSEAILAAFRERDDLRAWKSTKCSEALAGPAQPVYTVVRGPGVSLGPATAVADGERRYSAEVVLKLLEKDWESRGIEDELGMGKRYHLQQTREALDAIARELGEGGGDGK